MRWNCPHCQTSLTASDEQLSPNWLFSRCFHCGGNFLVRRPEVNVVKVDRVPEGERVLAAGPENPPLLSEQANRNLARYTAPPAKAVVRPVTSRRGQPPLQAVATPATAPRLPEAPANLRRKADPASSRHEGALAPSRHEGALAPSPAPAAASSAAQAQAFSPTDPPAPAASATPAPQVAPPMASLRDYLVPAPLPELATLAPSRPRLLPIAMGIAGAVMVGSGIYLFLEGQTVIEKARARANHPSVSLSKALKIAPGGEPDSRRPPEEARPSPAATLAANTTFTDQLHREAMAPERAPQPVQASLTSRAPEAQQAQEAQEAQAIPDGSSREAPMMIRTRRNNTRLRSGPGARFPIVAIVDRNARLIVKDWSENWFKVQLPDLNDPGKPAEFQALPQVAWVPTEVVQVISTDAPSR